MLQEKADAQQSLTPQQPEPKYGELPPIMRRLRPLIYLLIVLGTIAISTISVYQLYFLRTAGDSSSAMAVGSDNANRNVPDRRGMFITTSKGFYQILDLTSDVVNQFQNQVPADAARFLLGDATWVTVNGSMDFEAGEAHVYLLKPESNGQQEVPLQFEKVQRKSDKAVRFMAASGAWAEGAYRVEVPADSMYGGKAYAYFIVGYPDLNLGK